MSGSEGRRRVLVTGGAGFIGANFVHYWVREHPADEIVVLDALTYAGTLTSLEPLLGRPGLEFVQGDIRDPGLVEALLAEYEIDTIVHFAAESHVDRSIESPAGFVETNVLGTYVLLEAARRSWLGGAVSAGSDACRRFHHISTDEVYGSLGPDDPPASESTVYAPNSPYAASKAAADHLVRAYHRTYGLPVTTSNSANNFGPYQFPEKLIPLMLIRALEGKPLPVYGDGQNVRDWLHVEDHCRGIDLVIASGRPGETYNIGGDNQVRNIDLVHRLCELLDDGFREDPALAERFPDAPAARGASSGELIAFVTDRPGHDRRYALDSRKVRGLGFQPREAFEETLRATLGWYLDHESWWRGLMDGGYRAWMSRQYGPRATAEASEA